MLDILIRDGLIIDGTGNPGYYGSVGVDGESIKIFRGSVEDVEAARTIDATGLTVCPGFIDMHAHSGLVLLSEPEHEPKVKQGITTELIGVDGNSYAPFKSQDDFRMFVELNSGLDGNPPLPGSWSTVEQYLNMFDRKSAVNVAYILGELSSADRRHWVGVDAGYRSRHREHEGDNPRGYRGRRSRNVHRTGLPARRLCVNR